MHRFRDVVAENPIRGIEIKISQGAKPGRGGLLPAAKITPEIAKIRGIPLGQDCISPASHAEFRDVSSLLDFAEQLGRRQWATDRHQIGGRANGLLERASGSDGADQVVAWISSALTVARAVPARHLWSFPITSLCHFELA